MTTLIWKAPMSFLSAGDEAAFFSWLRGIPGVIAAQGVGRELHIGLKSGRLSQAGLRELIALYRRFGGRMSELAPFENSANTAWFRSPTAVWYEDVFATTPAS
jgi:hypothetical protein